MKLRLQGNSLRLRLTQKEVAELRASSRIESSIEFAPGQTLAYMLEGSPGALSVSAGFDGHTIVVTVPEQVLSEWMEGEQVSIEGPSQASLQLLIEKDFQCLHKPEHVEPDAYPHPLASRAGGTH